jgi:hypothetical protein
MAVANYVTGGMNCAGGREKNAVTFAESLGCKKLRSQSGKEEPHGAQGFIGKNKEANPLGTDSVSGAHPL